MRGAWPTTFLALSCTAGCGGFFSKPPEPPRAEAPAPVLEVPPWVPPPSAAQQALLAPVTRPVRTPAARVFPDLERFGYAPNRTLASIGDAVKFTSMVTQLLHDSPRFYALDEAPAEVANLIVQYGPASAPSDGLLVMQRDATGFGTLVPAPSADAARAVLAQGQALVDRGDGAGAVELFRAGIERSPGVPALRVALGAALQRAGQLPAAEMVYREALGVDPTYAPLHLGLAELAAQRRDRAAARRALVEALAYQPGDPHGLELASALGIGEFVGASPPTGGGWGDVSPPPASTMQGGGRILPFSILLDVDAVGAVHVATAKSDAAQIYGGCRAVMRYEPELRAHFFQQPRETPYYLSMHEEVVCIEAALGAYAVARSRGEPSDAKLDELFRIAHEEGLAGYVMVEILGPHRPERARAAPAEVHREMADYIERHVLASHRILSDAPYTAARSRSTP